MLAAIVMVISFFQSEQRNQLRKIYERLTQLQTPQHHEDPETLRLDRTAYLDALVLLEAELHSSQREFLIPDELNTIDATREMVKTINTKLVDMNEWMGAPFDLKWAETLERLPTLRRLYLNADSQMHVVDVEAEAQPETPKLEAPQHPVSPT